jgi:hypothetical protein
VDPISTVALVATFMMPLVPTRASDWTTKAIVRPFDDTRSSAGSESLISPSMSRPLTEQITSQNIAGPGYGQDRLQLLTTELNLYRDLSDGWNGPDSVGPNSSDIDDAQGLVAQLSAGLPIPKAMISSSGTIGLYWNTDHAFADIEFEGDGKFSLFTRLKSSAHDERFFDDQSLHAITPRWLSEQLAVLTIA